MSRPVYAPRGAQEARGTGYAVRGFVPAPFSPGPSPAPSMRCTCRRCAVRGCARRRCATWPQAGPGSNQVRGGSHPAPRTPLRCVPLLCHPYLRRVSPKPLWNPGRGPPRSVVTATFDGPLPAEPVLTTPQDGDTPVIVLTRACGRVAPVTRGSDVLVHVFPDGARRTGPLPPRSRDGPFGIRSADRQPPRTEFHAFSLARRRVDPVVHLILGTPSVPVRRGRYRCVFPFLRTARGVSIPARGVHGFLLRPFYALVGNLRFSEARSAVAWIPGPVAYGSPRGDFFLRHSVLPNALSPPRRGGPLAPASSASASAPSRERSAHRTRIEAVPQGPSATSSPLPSAAPKRAMRILRLRKIVLLKPGSSGTWGWFQKDTLRVSVVRYHGCAARASGIQLSVYRVSADRILLAAADAPGDLRGGSGTSS